MTSARLQAAKKLVRDFHGAFDAADERDLSGVLAAHTTPDYSWRGVHPFNEQASAASAVEVFWAPLRRSFSSLQRREDVFMAGNNVVDDGETVWVTGMGHFVGLFDRDWLGIAPNRRLTFLRYAEFHCVEGNKIAESAFFCDILSVMEQAGCYPLAPQTAAGGMFPGPKMHDGLLLVEQDPKESQKTIDLVHEMVSDLSELNKSGIDHCPPELLMKSWHDDMLWYGPTGIGATYTIPRYQEQHQLPFRTHLRDKVFNGHVARFAEGSYACFFGWANLTNTPTGGFLGLPGNDVAADMRVVDVYRREGDKLAENWVYIDFLHWLMMQGLDVLERNRELRFGPAE